MAAGAHRPSRRAYIFPDRTAALALKQGRPYASILGWVIAHEIGHILLPVQGHSETGIMRADLEIRSARPASFTAEQGTLIRTSLRAANGDVTVTADSADPALIGR